MRETSNIINYLSNILKFSFQIPSVRSDWFGYAEKDELIGFEDWKISE